MESPPRARSKAFLQRGDDVVQRALDRGAQETERNDDGDRDHTETDVVLGHGLAGLVADIGEKLVGWTRLPEGLDGKKAVFPSFRRPESRSGSPYRGVCYCKTGSVLPLEQPERRRDRPDRLLGDRIEDEDRLVRARIREPTQ